MADNELRELERRWTNSSGIGEGLTYAQSLARAGNLPGCYETLCDVFSSSEINDEQLRQAEQLFSLHLGRMYVVDQGDRWRMSYFTDDNRFVDEDLDKNLLDNGAHYMQREGKAGLGKKGRLMQGSADVSDLIIATYQHKDHTNVHQRELIRCIRKALEKSVTGDHWLMTDSRARYRSQETDLYIPHWSADVPADLQQGIELVLAGYHYTVRDGQNSDVNEAVFRTRNHSLVDEAFTDLGKQQPQVLRISQKPQQGANDDERVVVLGVGGSNFDIDLNVIIYFGSVGFARGWSRRTQKNIPHRIKDSGATETSFPTAQEMKVD